MRIAADHFGTQPARDVVERKRAALLGEPGVEHHLKQHVAQFATELSVIRAGLDGLGYLEGFLQEVLNQRGMGEGTHPRAVLAQLRYDPQQPFNRSRLSQGCRRRR